MLPFKALAWALEVPWGSGHLAVDVTCWFPGAQGVAKGCADARLPRRLGRAGWAEVWE